jgi:hypothetical protein
MGKFIIAVIVVAAIFYAFHAGWGAKWFGAAVDSGIDSVKSTQREATKLRPVDAPEAEKK